MSSSIAAVLVLSFCPGADPAAKQTSPYIDTSDPNSAALSLAVALRDGDVVSARKVYRGKDERLISYLELLETTKAKSDRLRAALIEKYGESGLSAFGSPFIAELTVPMGEKGETRTPMTVVVAGAETKVQGDVATLRLNESLEVRLRRSEGKWVVTDWPGPAFSLSTLLNYEIMNATLDELAPAIEQGRYPKLYQAIAAFAEITAKHQAEMFRELKESQKEDPNGSPAKPPKESK